MIETQLMSGVVSKADYPPFDAPADAWTHVNDVQFREGPAERVNGWGGFLGTASNDPLHVLNSYFDDSSYWLYGTELNIYTVSDDGTHYDITPTSAPSENSPNGWTSCELNGLPVMNFRKDAPVYWARDPLTAAAALPGWPSGDSCQVMRSFKNYLIALNLSRAGGEFPSVMAWSDAADPGTVPTTWTAAASNDAGEFSLGGTSEGISDGLALRDQFVVYKPHASYLVSYVGGTLIFGQREFSTTTGALAANCVAEIRNNHVFLADGDVCITDGQSIKSLIDRRARRKLFSELDQINYRNSFVFNNEPESEVWICYPENGQQYATRALVWHQDTDKLSFRDLSMGGQGLPHAAVGNISEASVVDTWASATYTWDSANAERAWNATITDSANNGIVGIDLDEPQLALLDAQNAPETGSIRPTLRKESIDFGEKQTVKLVNEVWPRITGEPGQIINIRLGAQMQADDDITWSPFQQYVLGTDDKVNSYARGRFISVELTATDGDVWRCTGLGLNIQAAGKF